jgi:hypothetical protein
MTTTEQLGEDLTLVINHVLRDEERHYRIHTEGQERARFACRVAEARMADQEGVRTILHWVLTAMLQTVRCRPLTDDEVLVYAAALRVAECLAMLDAIADLGRAFVARDWNTAREIWLRLAPVHALLIGLCPDVESLSIILQDRTSPPISIH